MSDFGYSNWALVLINVALFGVFILFISFRRKIARLPASIYLAFVVALYAEMYGFPSDDLHSFMALRLSKPTNTY